MSFSDISTGFLLGVFHFPVGIFICFLFEKFFDIDDDLFTVLLTILGFFSIPVLMGYSVFVVIRRLYKTRFWKYLFDLHADIKPYKDIAPPGPVNTVYNSYTNRYEYRTIVEEPEADNNPEFDRVIPYYNYSYLDTMHYFSTYRPMNYFATYNTGITEEPKKEESYTKYGDFIKDIEKRR